MTDIPHVPQKLPFDFSATIACEHCHGYGTISDKLCVYCDPSEPYSKLVKYLYDANQINDLAKSIGTSETMSLNLLLLVAYHTSKVFDPSVVPFHIHTLAAQAAYNMEPPSPGKRLLSDDFEQVVVGAHVSVLLQFSEVKLVEGLVQSVRFDKGRCYVIIDPYDGVISPFEVEHTQIIATNHVSVEQERYKEALVRIMDFHSATSDTHKCAKNALDGPNGKG